MLFKPDCIPCILNMSLTTMRRLQLDGRKIEEVYQEILEIPALQGDYENITFMFLSKCYPYEEHFSVDLHEPIMANFFEKRG